MPESLARVRHLRTSPYKAREVLELIRGLDVEAARQALQFSERGSAGDVLKVLDSAIANAEHNESLPSDELFVSRAYADEGPTVKRWRPRARGRGTRIRKRTCHVTVVVERYSEDELDRRRAVENVSTAVGGRRGRPRRAGRPARAERRGAAPSTGDATTTPTRDRTDETPDDLEEDLDELEQNDELDAADDDAGEHADDENAGLDATDDEKA